MKIDKVTGKQKKAIAAAVQKARPNGHHGGCSSGLQRIVQDALFKNRCETAKTPHTAQQTIRFKQMYRDGICKVTDRLYTKTIQFFDINYQLAQNEDKTAIFENYCDFLNYFDSTIKVQLSFLNQVGDTEEFMKQLEIQSQDDDFDDIRREYSEMLKNQLAKISPTSSQFINPLDINLNYSDEDNPLALKSDFILSMCELIVGGKAGLEPIEKTIIDRCVRMVYRDYLNSPDTVEMPILQDLYNLILKQTEPEAQRIATALEMYVTGSLNVFNHRTNVDLNNRLICFDIKELGKQLKKLGMLVVQDAVWNRVTVNRAEHKSTRYYIDEFHLLLKEEQTAAYSCEIWKRFRKWGGIPTGLTQNVKDLLASREIENIFENSDFIYMLNQAGGDRQILAKQLNISPHQLSYVTNSGAGEGLIFFGNIIIPFVDKFPKDMELYRIMTTRLEETENK